MGMVSKTGLLAGCVLLGFPAAAGAQEKTAPKSSSLPTVGIVTMARQAYFRELPTYARFYARMAELGWRPGTTIRYVERAADGDPAKLERAAKEFADKRLALIVAIATHEILAAKRATSSIPIVMVQPVDPVEMGIVASYNRPGGNITGNSATPISLAEKRMELLIELVPAARRIVQGYDAASISPIFDAALQKFAAKRNLEINRVELPVSGDYDAWVAKVKGDGAHAALLAHAASTFSPARRKALADALLKHRLASVCFVGEYVESGCLASYGVVLVDLYAKAAEYADKILRGAKPSDLPIQQPTTFQLMVNLKTANALGVTIPQSVLVRADEVIR